MPRSPLLGDRHAQVILGIAVVAAVAVAFAASPLPRITPDSASYLTGAEMLAEHGRFESCVERITLFAPAYSALMAPVVAVGIDAPDAARLVNLLATFSLVVGAGLLARGAGLSRRASVVVALAVGVSFATLRNGAHVWSEPLFCAILTWILVLVLSRGRGLDVRASARLAGLVVLTWALLLTRHSGVFVLPAILLAAWLGSASRANRLVRVGALGVALVAVPAAWWTRNVQIDGGAFGRRSQSRFTVLEVLGQLPDGLSSLAVPSVLPLGLRLVLAAPLVAAVVLAWRRSSDKPRARIAVAVLTTAAVVYAAGVSLSVMRTLLDPVDTRYLSPVLVPTAVLVAVGISSPRTRLERGLCGFALLVVGAMALLAPGVAWRGHEAERTLANIPEDVSCVEWPGRYSGEAIRLKPYRR